MTSTPRLKLEAGETQGKARALSPPTSVAAGPEESSDIFARDGARAA
jgi:hypothetical protein